MHNVPKGFGTVEDINRRIEKAAVLWELWRTLHQEAYDFSMPDRQTFRFHTPGARKNRHIYDTTATLGIVQFAARLVGSMVPPWSQWIEFQSGSDIAEKDKKQTDIFLKESTDIFFNHINQSNFSTEITSSFMDLGIGTGAIMVEELPLGEENVLRFSSVNLSELYPETPPGSVIQSTWRKQSVKAMHIEQVWPGAELNTNLTNAVKNDPMRDITFWNGIIFNPDDKKYHQLVFFKDDKLLIFTQSFKRKRLIPFRWSVTAGDVFGRGPIIHMLPDIRTLNKMKEFILNNAAIQMAGVYTASDDGFFNPHTVRIAPGAIIPVKSNDRNNPSLTPMTPSGNLNIGDLMMQNIQDNVRKSLFADPLGDFEDSVRSATEMQLRTQEMLRMSGAQISRVVTEMLNPLVGAVVEILQSRGLMPLFRVDGEEVKIKPVSPLAKAENLEDFQNTQVWLGALLAAQIPPEVIAGTVKIEDLPKEMQEQLSVNPKLIRSDDEREALGKQLIEQSQNAAGEPPAPGEQPTRVQ